MTREEALQILDTIPTISEQVDALEMAIQALSQEPITTTNNDEPIFINYPIITCDDAVSRQAILDGIEELKKSPWATANRSHGYEYLITEALDVVKDLCVKQLPSVTTKIIECDDAISREDARMMLICEIKDGMTITEYIKMVDKRLRKLPPVTHKSGKWQVVSDGYGDSAYICECSECKDTVWVYKNADRKWKYCPNCGARMESEVRNDNNKNV